MDDDPNDNEFKRLHFEDHAGEIRRLIEWKEELIDHVKTKHAETNGRSAAKDEDLLKPQGPREYDHLAANREICRLDKEYSLKSQQLSLLNTDHELRKLLRNQTVLCDKSLILPNPDYDEHAVNDEWSRMHNEEMVRRQAMKLLEADEALDKLLYERGNLPSDRELLTPRNDDYDRKEAEAELASLETECEIRKAAQKLLKADGDLQHKIAEEGLLTADGTCELLNPGPEYDRATRRAEADRLEDEFRIRDMQLKIIRLNKELEEERKRGNSLDYWGRSPLDWDEIEELRKDEERIAQRLEMTSRLRKALEEKQRLQFDGCEDHQSKSTCKKRPRDEDLSLSYWPSKRVCADESTKAEAEASSTLTVQDAVDAQLKEESLSWGAGGQLTTTGARMGWWQWSPFHFLGKLFF